MFITSRTQEEIEKVRKQLKKYMKYYNGSNIGDFIFNTEGQYIGYVCEKSYGCIFAKNGIETPVFIITASNWQ